MIPGNFPIDSRHVLKRMPVAQENIKFSYGVIFYLKFYANFPSTFAISSTILSLHKLPMLPSCV